MDDTLAGRHGQVIEIVASGTVAGREALGQRVEESGNDSDVGDGLTDSLRRGVIVAATRTVCPR